MADFNFHIKSVKELQKYLKERGVIFSDLRRPELLEICEAAERLGIDVDPDGLLEDRDDVLREKLQTPENINLPNPDTIQGFSDLTILPPFAIFDIYNYLLHFEQYSHSMLRDYKRMEAYGLFEDGYVLNVECCSLDGDYCAVKSNVKPRTNDMDPISKLKYYKVWIVFRKSDKGTVFSAYCSCKGGIDGGCRHVVATLFEISDFVNDRSKDSITSGPCLWVRRSTKTTDPVLVTDLDTSLTEVPEDSIVKPTESVYTSIPPDTSLPKAEEFVNFVRDLQPKACMLDAWEIRDSTVEEIELDIKLPLEKTLEFWKEHTSQLYSDECRKQFLDHLIYPSEDIVKIADGTRGQNENRNWKAAREGLLTSSNFKTICHSTNMDNTAKSLLKGSSIDEAYLPTPVAYGRKNEPKARDMFLKAHRFRHRKCKIDVPGLVISSSDPLLGCSPDGIIDCSLCGPFLIEIKCMQSHQNFHPSPALLGLKICEKNGDKLQIIKQHRYNYQIQGQMGITGIKKCVLVGFTNKGIFPVDVNFDEDMWNKIKSTLIKFYHNNYLPELLRQNNII